MGAKFAPSLANIFMAKWEEDVVYALERPEIVLWARYIDDILLLWRGDRLSLDEFMAGLNLNQVGISLTYEASYTNIHFLDLDIFARDGPHCDLPMAVERMAPPHTRMSCFPFPGIQMVSSYWPSGPAM